MKIITEVTPKWGEYYVAIVKLRPTNPKHKVIIHIDDVKGDKIYYTPLNYEDRGRYTSTGVTYFELIERINMDRI